MEHRQTASSKKSHNDSDNVVLSMLLFFMPLVYVLLINITKFVVIFPGRCYINFHQSDKFSVNISSEFHLQCPWAFENQILNFR